MLLKYYLLAAM